MTTETQARALNYRADETATTRVGMPFEYLKYEQTLTLLADGDRQCRLLPQFSTISLPPTFHPTAATGGTVTFAIPPQTTQLQLLAGFATYSGTDEGDVDYPTIQLPIGEEPDRAAAAAQEEPLQTIPDQPFKVVFHRAYRENGRIVVDVGVEHTGGPHGGLDLDRRLRLTVASKNSPLTVDTELASVFADGMGTLPIFMRPGDKRRVRLAFADSGDNTAILSYSGITTNVDMPLALGGDGNTHAWVRQLPPILKLEC